MQSRVPQNVQILNENRKENCRETFEMNKLNMNEPLYHYVEMNSEYVAGANWIFPSDSFISLPKDNGCRAHPRLLLLHPHTLVPTPTPSNVKRLASD